MASNQKGKEKQGHQAGSFRQSALSNVPPISSSTSDITGIGKQSTSESLSTEPDLEVQVLEDTATPNIKVEKQHEGPKSMLVGVKNASTHSFGTELIGVHRDGNEEKQCSQDLPHWLHDEECMTLRDRAPNKITAEFVAAARNRDNTFFSHAAIEADVEEFLKKKETDSISGAEKASFPFNSAEKDVTNSELIAYQEADVYGLNILAIAGVDNRGRRLVAQNAFTLAAPATSKDDRLHISQHFPIAAPHNAYDTGPGSLFCISRPELIRAFGRACFSSTAILAVCLESSVVIAVDSLQCDPDTEEPIGMRDKMMEVCRTVFAAGTGDADLIMRVKERICNPLSRHFFDNSATLEDISSFAVTLINAELLPDNLDHSLPEHRFTLVLVGMKNETKGIYIIGWEENTFAARPYSTNVVNKGSASDFMEEFQEWGWLPENWWSANQIADWCRDCLVYAYERNTTCGGQIQVRVISRDDNTPFTYSLMDKEGYEGYHLDE